MYKLFLASSPLHSLLRFFSVWPKHHPFSWFQSTFSLLYRVFVKFLRQICFLLHFCIMIHDITVHLLCEPLKVENTTLDIVHLVYSKVCAWNMMDNNFLHCFNFYLMIIAKFKQILSLSEMAIT